MTTKQDAMEAAARAMEAVEEGSSNINLGAAGDVKQLVQAAVQAYLAAREAEGFVMVPAEPTQDMIVAGWRHAGFPAVQGYRAMLAVRPTNGGA